VAGTLTMGPAGDLAAGAVAFASGEVLAVGPFDELARSFPDAEVVGDDREVVLPGLGEELTPFEWATRIVVPAGRHLTAEMARVGAMLKGAELLLSGVTCVSDMFHHTNMGSLASLDVVDGLEAMGLRGVVAFGAEDVFDPHPVAAFLDEHQALADRCAAAPRVGFRRGSAPCPARATSCSPPRRARPASAAGRSTPTSPRSGRRSSRPACAGPQRRGTVGRRRAAGGAGAGRPLHLGRPGRGRRARQGGRGRGAQPGGQHDPRLRVCPVPALRAAGMVVGLGTDGAASTTARTCWRR
jgi:5-methylthioadenosine/S-adenosylhomocysteine deaminase